jgi:hypothetical protein
MEQNSDLASGSAIPRAPVEDIPKHEAPVSVYAKHKPDVWIKGIPQQKQHFLKFREHVKPGPHINLCLDLRNKNDMKILNGLYVKAHDDTGDGPKIVVVGQERQVVGAKWLCHVVYHDIFYRRLDINANTPDTTSDSPSK